MTLMQFFILCAFVLPPMIVLRLWRSKLPPHPAQLKPAPPMPAQKRTSTSTSAWDRECEAWLHGDTPRERRRSRMAMNGGSHTAAEWQALCAVFGYRCVRCKQKRKLTRDHVIPVVDGGSDNIGNIQPMCQPCNSSKGSRYADYRGI